MGQKDDVLEYIRQNGSITSLEAFNYLEITRLSAVIFELKRDGYEFDTKTERHVNLRGRKKHYTRYSLKK